MTSIQLVLEDLARAMRQEKEIKSIKIQKKERKLLLLAHDIIVYRENLMKATRKLLELINEFNRLQGIKA